MRTKHLLTMAAMTLGFAACTQEELIENVASNPMDRPALDMTIEFPGTTVDSRLVYDDASFGWKWEAGDKFSAFMTDGASAGTVADDLATNYIYSQGEDGSYSTTSQMVEGMYWFYAPAKEDKINRSLISYELSTNQPANYYKSEASQVYFSPIYKLEAKNNAANVVLKPTVYNLYSQAIFHFKNTPTGPSHTDINVLQVILKASNNVFAVKGELSPEKIAEANTLAYDANSGAFVQTDPDNDGVINTEETLKTADVCNHGDLVDAIALNVNETLKKNGTLTVTMLVPQTGETDYTVTVVTDKGNIEIDGTEAPELNNVTFKHHGAKYMFGKLSNNAMKPFVTNSGEIDTTPGARYVSSAEDMVSLINQTQTALKIKRVGDWAINEDVIKAANNNANVNIKFLDAMNVENNTAAELEMNKFEFGDGWTLVKGAIKTADAPTTVKGGKLNYTGTEALVNDGGEITVNNANVTSVTNNSGKVILNKSVNLTTLTNGNPTGKTTGEIVVNKGYVVTVSGTFDNSEWSDANGNVYDSSIEINGEFYATGMTNNGKITNNNVLVGGTNVDKIYNNGEASNIVNNGYIEMMKEEAAASTITGTGIINNNLNGYVKATGNTVYFEASGTIETINSGANLVVVKDASISEANLAVDVLFLGNTIVRTNLVTTKNIYVGCENTDNNFNKIAQIIVGKWSSSNNYADYMAATKLTNYGTVTANGIYNYATVLNRGEAMYGDIMKLGIWNGDATVVTAASIGTAAAGAIIVLPEDEPLELTAALEISKDITIKGGEIKGGVVNVKAGATNVTFDNVKFSDATTDQNGVVNQGSSIYIDDLSAAATITIKGCTFEGFAWDAIQLNELKELTEVVIDGNTFVAPATANTSGSFIHIALDTPRNNVKVEIKNNDFGSMTNFIGDYGIKIYGIQSWGKILGGNNTFADAENIVKNELFFSLTKNGTKFGTGVAYNKLTASTVTAFNE